MNLLQATTIKLGRFKIGEIPPYAILLHRWEKDAQDEVTFQDMQKPNVVEKARYLKIKYFCEEAVRKGLGYVQVNTCCIDKSSCVELSEAINSIFKWYKDAVKCFAYLMNMYNVYNEDEFRSS